MNRAIEQGALSQGGAEALRRSLEPDQALAIGLAWGHLNTRQYRAAYTLTQGCLSLWPGQPLLKLLGAYAALELGMALDDDTRRLLDSVQYRSLAPLILRRAAFNQVMGSVTA